MKGSCETCGAAILGPILEGLCPRCVAGTMFPMSEIEGVKRIGDYELLGELGRGGMGVVYLARQVSLDRLVALKVLVGAAHAGSESRARFQREAREAARLRHPHIVAIHEVGELDGSSFYSMDLIEGDDLESYFATRGPSPRAAAALVALAARAVHYAHEAGVLHRDIKPGNILIDQTGEPHLTDFGLAIAVDGGGRLTQPGEVLGSPAYAAPEQLRGLASVACDVYSLGAVLYFLLTRRPPFVAAQLPALLDAVERGDPVPPRRLDPSLPRDLETIALRALAREPSRRFASAGALADDLMFWIEGRPITARPVSPFERGWRWSRRNRALSAVAALLGLALLIGGAGVTWQWRLAENARSRTAAHLYTSDLKIASDALLSGDLGSARRVLERCPPESRDAVWGLLWPQASGDAELVAASARWTVTDLDVSANGTYAVGAVQDDVVRLWNLETGEEVRTFPGTEGSNWVKFGPDGRDMFTGNEVIRQWSLADGSLIREFPGQTGAISPDGEVLYACVGNRFVFSGEPGSVSAWRVADGTKIFELPVSARVLALSSDGSRIAVSDAKSSIAIFDAHDGRCLIEAWPSIERVWHLTFSPDGRQLVASGWSPDIRIWDLANVAAGPRFLKHPLNTWQAEFSMDGTNLAVACSDQAVHVWHTETWAPARVRRGHENEVWSIAWQTNDDILAAGRDPRLMRWGMTESRAAPGLRHGETSTNIVWVPGGLLATSQIGAGGEQGTVVTNLRSWKVEASFPGESPLAYDPATRRLWSWAWAEPGKLIARDIVTFDTVATVPWPRAPGELIAGSPQVVPSAGVAWVALQDGSLEFLPLADGRPTERFERVFSKLPYLVGALSPDGRWFVWTRGPKQQFILDRVSGAREPLEGHHYELAGIAFAPDGATFVTGGHDGLIFEWTTEPPHRRHEIGRLRTSVGQVGFSSDEHVLVLHEPDVGVRLWNRASAREVAFLPEAATGAGEWSDFSIEGDWFAMRRADGRIRLWPIVVDDAQAR